jgi:hypothetical protein
MLRSRQPRPATSPSPRTLPLPPFSHTDRPILCLSPLPTSPNSTHPTQLDTPVPSQPLCYQSYPHAFRHTWGCPSVLTLQLRQLQSQQCLRSQFPVNTRLAVTGLPRTPTKVLLSRLRFADRDGEVDRMCLGDSTREKPHRRQLIAFVRMGACRGAVREIGRHHQNDASICIPAGCSQRSGKPVNHARQRN